MQRALAAWLLLAVAPVASSGPTEIVQAAVDQIVQALDDPALARPAMAERRRAEIRRIADRVFDFHEMARRALARHWADRTPQERDEFVRLFRELVERAYIGKLEAYAGEKVIWGPETVEGESATVRSRILSRRGEIALHYRLHWHGGRWAIYDMAIEGVSLVSSYRSQFARIIQTSSYGDLVRKLRARDLSSAVVERAAP